MNTCTACYVIFVEWNVCTHLMPNNRKVRVILWVKDLELHSLYHTFILITHLVLLFYSFNWSGFKRKWRSSLLILEWLSSAATFFVIWWPKISIFLPLQKFLELQSDRWSAWWWIFYANLKQLTKWRNKCVQFVLNFSCTDLDFLLFKKRMLQLFSCISDQWINLSVRTQI